MRVGRLGGGGPLGHVVHIIAPGPTRRLEAPPGAGQASLTGCPD